MTVPYISPSRLRPLADAWRAALLDDGVAQLLEGAVARVADVKRQNSEFVRGDDGTAALGQLVARRELTLEAAVAAHAARGQRDVAATLARAAERAVIADVAAELSARGPALLDMLAAREADVFAQAAKPAAAIGAAAQPDEAFAAGGKATSAWHALDDLAGVCDQLTKVHQGLTAFGVPGRWEAPAVPDDRERWTAQSKTASAYGGARVRSLARVQAPHRVRRFADRVVSGVGPRVVVDESRHQASSDA